MDLELDDLTTDKKYTVADKDGVVAFTNLRELFLEQKNDSTKYAVEWLCGKVVHGFVLGRLHDYPDTSRVVVAFGPRGNYGILDTRGVIGVDPTKLQTGNSSVISGWTMSILQLER